jgi:hypothetical protein
VTFLGYRISSEGSRPLDERVSHLKACPPPKTVRQLRQFLGMLNFYRRFLPHTAATQAPHIQHRRADPTASTDIHGYDKQQPEHIKAERRTYSQSVLGRQHSSHSPVSAASAAIQSIARHSKTTTVKTYSDQSPKSEPRI